MVKEKVNLDNLLHVAQMAAMEAGDHALRQFTRTHVLKEKVSSTDELTTIDIENEKIILKILQKNFPQHSIFTEERDLPKEKKKYIWWIDPLDGSISYAFGLPYWGVTLCLIGQKEPLVGVTYFPQNHELYWAIKGRGTFCNYRKLAVSKKTLLIDGVIGIDYGYRNERQQGLKDATRKLIDQVKYVVSYACIAASLALVAEGKLVAHLHHMARKFDHAAGSLLVAEAGGNVTDSYGQRIDWRDIKPLHIVTSNGRVHQEIIKLLQ